MWFFRILRSWVNFFLLVMLYHASSVNIFWWHLIRVLRSLDIKCQFQFSVAGNLWDFYLLINDIGSLNSYKNIHFIFFTVVRNRLSTYWLTKIFNMIQYWQKQKFFTRKLQRNISDKLPLVKAIENNLNTFWLGRWFWHISTG